MIRLYKLQDKYKGVKSYSLKKNGKTLFQIADTGEYVRFYPVDYKMYPAQQELVSISIKETIKKKI